MACFPPSWIFFWDLLSIIGPHINQCAIEFLSVTTWHYDPDIGAGTRTGTRTRGIGGIAGNRIPSGSRGPWKPQPHTHKHSQPFSPLPAQQAHRMTKCTAFTITYGSRMTVAATAILTPEAYCTRVQARLEGEDTISRVVFSINRGSSGHVNTLMIKLDKQHNIAPKYKLVQQLVEDESTACHVDVDFEKIDNFSKNIIKDMRIFDEGTSGCYHQLPCV